MTGPAGCVEDRSCPTCCNRAATMWAEEELMASVILAGGLLRTDLVDMLGAQRARIVVGLCLAAGGLLEHGDQALFDRAVHDAGRSGSPGWWRQALDMPARPVDTRPARPAAFTA
jgi:hypothetical protein